VKGPHVHLGLALSTFLTGALVLAVMLLWRAPPSDV
jgi:hypothetical protein